MTGKELVQKLIERDGKSPGFTVMTGFGDEKIAVEMMRLGANHYLIKESDFIEILIAKLERIIEELEKNKENERYQKLLNETERLAGVGRWFYNAKPDNWTMSDNWMACI